MIAHCLKTAIRNHSKYRVQSIISLLSLAIAFACVSLATYWIHYEQTFDSFLPGYDRIYKVANKGLGEIYPDDMTQLPLPTHLVENYPEVDKAWGVSPEWMYWHWVEINNHSFQSGCTEITPEAVEILDIQWLEGNRDIDSWAENEVAVSEDIVRKVCEKNSPIGMKLKLRLEEGAEINSEYQIVAVLKTRPKHSNFNFEILKKLPDTIRQPLA